MQCVTKEMSSGYDGADYNFCMFLDINISSSTMGCDLTVLTLCGLGASVAADYDLTGQLVWPGAGILNDYLVNHSHLLDGRSVIELGSGVGKKPFLLSF